MLFNLEYDSGGEVVGYCVPDGFSGSATLSIHEAGIEVAEIPATEPRPVLMAAGRHETGNCGFRVDEKLVPALGQIADLALFDRDSGIMVYRRPQTEHTRRKLVRLETHLRPLAALDAAALPHFQHVAVGADRYGRETLTQLFLLNNVNSSYLSARFLYKNYAFYAGADFDLFTIVQDPHREIAERMLLFHRGGGAAAPALGERDALFFRPAIDFFRAQPFGDLRALRRGLRAMPDEAASKLANPLVRQLTTTTLEEMPGGGAVASALDVLSSFKMIGFREDMEKSLADIGALFQFKAAGALAEARDDGLEALVAMLKDTKAVDLYIEKDLELFGNLRSAAQKAMIAA